MIAVSQSILESLAPIVRPAGALGGGALSPKIGRRRSFSRENLSLTQRRQPASDAMREGSDALPCVGFAHVLEHGAADDRKPGEAFLESGEVCRERDR